MSKKYEYNPLLRSGFDLSGEGSDGQSVVKEYDDTELRERIEELESKEQTEYVAGENVRITDNQDGTKTISASGGSESSGTEYKAGQNIAIDANNAISAKGYVYDDSKHSFAESGTTATGNYSHAEGQGSWASGNQAHVEGYFNMAEGHHSHAEGNGTIASGTNSHSEGMNAIALGDNQHVSGKFNIEDTHNEFAEIIGGGTSENNRANIRTLDWNGIESVNGVKAIDGAQRSSRKYFATDGTIQQVAESSGGGTEYVAGDNVEITDNGDGTKTINAVSGSGYREGDNIEIDENRKINALGYTYNETAPSFSELQSKASGANSHAEGNQTNAIGASSHAEGNGVKEEWITLTFFREESNGEMYLYSLGLNYIRVLLPGMKVRTMQGVEATVLEKEGIAEEYAALDKKFENEKTDVQIVFGAYGDCSHVEGNGTVACGDNAHAEGNSTTVFGANSHAEGNENLIIGKHSHVEGCGNRIKGDGSHAEGSQTAIYASFAHAEGRSTVRASFAHSEGKSIVYNNATYAHAEGDGAASGAYSHAEGHGFSNGAYSHGENRATANGGDSHAEGNGTTNAIYSHAEGAKTTANGDNSHAEGSYSISNGESSHAEGYGNLLNNGSIANGKGSHAEGCGSVANGEGSHAEGSVTSANGNFSHAEGKYVGLGYTQGKYLKFITEEMYLNALKSVGIPSNPYQGRYYYYPMNGSISVSDYNKMAEYIGRYVTDGVGVAKLLSIGKELRPEASEYTTIVLDAFLNNVVSFSDIPPFRDNENSPESGSTGIFIYAQSIAFGEASHSEGIDSIAYGEAAHAEGAKGLAEGNYSHAEGQWTRAKGDNSHAEGLNTVALGDNQHVSGKYNVEDTHNEFAEIVGGGASDNNRVNIRTLDWNGIESVNGVKALDSEQRSSKKYFATDGTIQQVPASGDGNVVEYDDTELRTRIEELEGKEQAEYIAGDNVEITDNGDGTKTINTIEGSAKYAAGKNVVIDENNRISAVIPKMPEADYSFKQRKWVKKGNTIFCRTAKMESKLLYELDVEPITQTITEDDGEGNVTEREIVVATRVTLPDFLELNMNHRICNIDRYNSNGSGYYRRYGRWTMTENEIIIKHIYHSMPYNEYIKKTEFPDEEENGSEENTEIIEDTTIVEDENTTETTETIDDESRFERLKTYTFSYQPDENNPRSIIINANIKRIYVRCEKDVETRNDTKKTPRIIRYTDKGIVRQFLPQNCEVKIRHHHFTLKILNNIVQKGTFDESYANRPCFFPLCKVREFARALVDGTTYSLSDKGVPDPKSGIIPNINYDGKFYYFQQLLKSVWVLKKVGSRHSNRRATKYGSSSIYRYAFKHYNYRGNLSKFANKIVGNKVSMFAVAVADKNGHRISEGYVIHFRKRGLHFQIKRLNSQYKKYFFKGRYR